MNNDIKDLLLAKKEKINEWLEYLSSEDDDVIWIQRNRVFCTVLYNIIYKLQKVASDDFIKKQEELIYNIHHYINNRDRLKVKEIVNKIKDLDNGKEICDDTDFNNYDQVINDIDNKLEQLKKEKLEGKTPEEQEKINEQWNKEDKIFNNIASSMINGFKENKIKNLAKNLFENMGINCNEFDLNRIDDINATHVMPHCDGNERYRGGTVIIGDDGTYLVCGSVHPVNYYINEFKNGKRDNITEEQNDLGTEKIESIRKAIINNLNEWLNYLNIEQNDPAWKPRNNLFLNRINVSLDILTNINDNEMGLQLMDLAKTIPNYIDKEDRENVKAIINKIKELANGNGINKTKINYVNKENLDDSIKISKYEYELLKKYEEDSYKMQRTDFALIINSGAVLPASHVNYNNDRVKLEIYDSNNHNIEINGEKYIIKTQALFNKIKSFIDNNLDLLIDWSKKETNYFLDNNAYDGGKSRNIKVKYGQLLINVNGQVSGELGKNIEDFINKIKELIISGSISNDKDYMIYSLIENNQIEKNNSYSDNDETVNLIVNEIEKMDDGAYFNFMELVNHFIELANVNANSKVINLNKIYDAVLIKLEESNINIKPVITNSTSQSQEKLYIKVGKKEIPTEVSDLLKNFVSFDEDGYAFANQELPSELKTDYDTFIKNYYTNDNNKIVNNIVNKIREISYNTETSIAELINYKPEEALVSPLTQGIIINAVEKKCNDYNIKLEFSSDSFGGLAYFEKFKKIN